MICDSFSVERWTEFVRRGKVNFSVAFEDVKRLFTIYEINRKYYRIGNIFQKIIMYVVSVKYTYSYRWRIRKNSIWICNFVDAKWFQIDEKSILIGADVSLIFKLH